MKYTDKETTFDLMFCGCQGINAPMAAEILKAIKEGKIRGVTYNKDKK